MLAFLRVSYSDSSLPYGQGEGVGNKKEGHGARLLDHQGRVLHDREPHGRFPAAAPAGGMLRVSSDIVPVRWQALETSNISSFAPPPRPPNRFDFADARRLALKFRHVVIEIGKYCIENAT